MLKTIKGLFTRPAAPAPPVKRTTSVSTGLMSGAPTPIVLWSTTCHLKFVVQERFYGTHYCWCSPVFEAAALGRYEVGSKQARSSDPATIYRDLYNFQRSPERHDTKVASFRKSILEVALRKRESHEIDDITMGRIAAMVRNASTDDWRPILYVIPFAGLERRIHLVDIEDAASSEPEYIINDLGRDEFEPLEFSL